MKYTGRGWAGWVGWVAEGIVAADVERVNCNAAMPGTIEQILIPYRLDMQDIYQKVVYYLLEKL
jgi:hypothetical protein